MQEGALTGAGAGLGAQPGPWQPPQGPHVYGMPWSGAAFLPTGPLLGAGPSLALHSHAGPTAPIHTARLRSPFLSVPATAFHHCLGGVGRMAPLRDVRLMGGRGQPKGGA